MQREEAMGTIGQEGQVAMTTILITPPAVPCDVTAEQVVAYLLAKGWRDISICPLPPTLWQKFRRDTFTVDVPLDSRLADHAALLTECIGKIARAENRPALDVLADILGPEVGTVGVGCET